MLISDTLAIQEIFVSFQGEGPRTGEAAVFIRLAGCNLNCEFCDTKFDSPVIWKTDTIISKVEKLSANKIGLIVITGGEPLNQPIENLCDSLIDKGFIVQIETNGTLYRNLNHAVEIVCSPKNITGSYKKIRKDLLKRITALKFLISADNQLYNMVAEVGQAEHKIPVYVQPIDENNKERNAANLKLAKKLVQEYGYILSEQTHKKAGVR